jgi:hypothetical protein
MRSDRQLGARLRRAFEVEPPPALSMLDLRKRAATSQPQGGDAGVGDRRVATTRLEQPVPTAPGLEVATDTSDRLEQQRRELEQVRRRFAEVGKRMGSAFEPPPSEHHPSEQVQPVAAPPTRPARPRWQVAATLALVFLLGSGFGYLLPQAAGDDRPAAASPPPPTAAATPSSPASQARIVTRVPAACLETARKGDEVFALLSSNVSVNDRRLAEALKAYTLASQACRQQATP